MAFITCDFFSDSLKVSTSITVILPQTLQHQVGMDSKANCEPPVLYLLHGMSDDHTTWVRRTAIERYVAPLGLAVIMPRVDRSYYTDMAIGGAYWTYLSEELPQVVNQFFRLSTKRENTFVAGLSMGGYGAFKLAFNQPHRFAAAASLSGALDPDRLSTLDEFAARRPEFEVIFGSVNQYQQSVNDLVYQSARMAQSGTKPVLYQCCGTEDTLIEGNRRFRDHLISHDYDLTYIEDPGSHKWGYWDTHIQKVLAWLPLHHATEGKQ